MAHTAMVMAQPRPRSSRLQPISRVLGSGMDFSVAEIAAAIDGRTAIPAHGSRDAHLGCAFWEMAGGGPTGEAVVQEVLRILIDYLQAIQQ